MKYIYSYDMIRINSTQDPKELKKHFPYDLIKRCKINKPYHVARRKKYNSRIELFTPSYSELKILDKYKEVFNDYSISYIEIARDCIVHNEREAESLFNRNEKYLCKKYTEKVFIYKDKADYKDIESNDPSKFAKKTLYLGQKGRFQFACYPRYSKINLKPCLHEEWKITGAVKINDKTGIKTISDLLTFDKEDFMLTQQQRQLHYQEIDKFKLGKWILDWDRRKEFSKRERIRIGINANHFCYAYGINSYAGLKQVIKKFKDILKNHRGRKTKWEKKIMSVNHTKFSRPV